MRVMMGAVVAIIVLGLLSGTSTAQTQFEAQLDRPQPVPPIPVSGGTGTFSLNADGTELTYEIRVVEVPNVAASHFHNAPAGQSGGVVRGIEGSFDGDVWVSSGVWSSSEGAQPLTAELLAELNAGNIYANIHTSDYGSGEVRGQIVAAGSTSVETQTWGKIKNWVEQLLE